MSTDTGCGIEGEITTVTAQPIVSSGRERQVVTTFTSPR